MIFQLATFRSAFFLFILSCLATACSKPHCPLNCQNGEKDGNETGVDCGGDCLNTCTLKKVVFQPGPEGLNVAVSSLSPNLAQGTYFTNFIESWTNQGNIFNSRMLLNFDYSTLPASINVQKATLTLYADTTFKTYPNTTLPNGHSQYGGSNAGLLKRIVQSWDENTVTWNTQPAADNESTIYVPPSTSRYQDYSIDVTPFLKYEFSTGTHYGVSLEMLFREPYRALVFHSDDGNYPLLKPKLEIEYY